MYHEFISGMKCSQTRINTPPKETINLFSGIDLVFWTAESTASPIETAPSTKIMQINYCTSGKAAVKINDENPLELDPGDCIIMDPSSTNFFSTCERYSGITINIDMQKVTAEPLQIFEGTDLQISDLYEKHCADNELTYISGVDQVSSIFNAFYGYPMYLRLPHLRIKTLELLLCLMRSGKEAQAQPSAVQSELSEIIKEIHDLLTERMDERITIDELAKRYLINPTTLKSAFKEIYGTSIAAHIREHRMEEAARLLRETHLSICEIARVVGYDSQSKFAVAFKGYFGVLPREYRKE